MVNQKLIDDLSYWVRRVQPCECSGMRLNANDCYHLGLVLECAYDSLLQLKSDLDIERSRMNVLDPEGSRLRLAMQRENGASPYEERSRRAAGWRTETEEAKGKSVFRNL